MDTLLEGACFPWCEDFGAKSARALTCALRVGSSKTQRCKGFPVDFFAYFILRTRDGRGDGALRNFGAGTFSCAAHNLWPQKKENKTHAPNKPCAPPPPCVIRLCTSKKGDQALRLSGCPPDPAESRVPQSTRGTAPLTNTRIPFRAGILK